MIDTNGNVVERSAQRGDLYVYKGPSGLANIWRLTRFGKRMVSLRSPFNRYNKYGTNRSRTIFDAWIEDGTLKLRVPQPEDTITGSLGGKCRVVEVTTRLATAIDQSDETHYFPVDDLSLTAIYKDNRAYWFWAGGKSDGD